MFLVTFEYMILLRKNIILLIFCTSLCITSYGQNAELEKTSLDWLKKNLTYNYLNPDQGKWWLNKMEFSLQNGTIHIQNASTVNPKKFRERSWIDRRVSLSFLDPYSISINPVNENRGRIVKGSVLVINVVHNEKKIGKTLDGKKATPESFLQFSIPSSLSDTVEGFADSLKFHLVQAIEAQSMLFNAGDLEKNIEKVFQTLRGEFISGSVTRSYSGIFRHVVQFEDKLGAKPIRSGFFGFDEGRNVFFESIVEDGKQVTTYYEIANTSELSLIGMEDRTMIIELTSLLHFIERKGPGEEEFRRISY